MPPGTPPLFGPLNNQDWAPYESRLQFETAELLFKRIQMSAGNIDTLLHLWAASLIKHGDKPPFNSCDDLYDIIDDTPVGDVKWESFSVRYNGQFPEHNIPSWMNVEHEVWFRDPRAVVRSLLANPDFDGEFDYSPLQEYDSEGNHRFQDFMSGDWAWRQAVCLIFWNTAPFHIYI